MEPVNLTKLLRYGGLFLSESKNSSADRKLEAQRFRDAAVEENQLDAVKGGQCYQNSAFEGMKLTSSAGMLNVEKGSSTVVVCHEKRCPRSPVRLEYGCSSHNKRNHHSIGPQPGSLQKPSTLQNGNGPVAPATGTRKTIQLRIASKDKLGNKPVN